MILTVFRARMKPDVEEEYVRWATRMSDLARQMPGFVSHKVFVADDGERVTLVEFESEQAQREWSLQREHMEAKRKGRSEFYAEFQVQVCEIRRTVSFPFRIPLGALG